MASKEATPTPRHDAEVEAGRSASPSELGLKMEPLALDSWETSAAMTPSSNKAPKPAHLGYRHVQVFVLSAGIAIAYTMRSNINLAIVAMMDSAGANPNFPEYTWTEGQKSLVLSSFFWGYTSMQLPAGQLALMFGPKLLLAISIFGSALFSILTPGAAAWGGWGLVCAFRMVQGLCQGLLMASTATHLARWLPIEERDTLSTLVFAGGLVGTIVVLPSCGFLSTSPLGWPANFYVFGVLGLVWTGLWLYLGASSPSEHPRISDQELRYILDSLAGGTTTKKKLATPWKSLLTSLPLWAVIVANFGQGWGFATLLIQMPTFMATVLGFDLQANGALSALPYLAMFLMSFMFSSLSALVGRKQLMSVTASRKLFNSIGLWVPMVALIGLSYSTSGVLSVVLLTLTVGFNASTYVGYNVNIIDLAPNFSGTIMGFSNAASAITAVISPLVVGAVVTESGNAAEWRTVFFIAAGVYLFTNAFYIAFGSAEPQAWNSPKPEPKAEPIKCQPLAAKIKT